MSSNTRVHPRAATQLAAHYRLEGDGEWVPTTVLNLSAGGAGLLSPEPIEPMTAIAGARFMIPDPAEPGRGTAIETAGLVLHCQRLAHEPGYVVGVHFLDLTPAVSRHLSEYVWSELGKAQGSSAPVVPRGKQ